MYQGYFSFYFSYLNSACIMVLAKMSTTITWQCLETKLVLVEGNEISSATESQGDVIP